MRLVLLPYRFFPTVITTPLYRIQANTYKWYGDNTDHRKRGIYYWNENIKLIESCEDLDLPPLVRTRNKILKDYCRLRVKCYELLYKAVSEDSDQYQAQIEDYNKQIDEKISELTGRE